jgi:hypothetical protein
MYGCLFHLLSYNRFQETNTFQVILFTGVSVKQFEDTYKVIESKYTKHVINRLSPNKRNREKERAVGGAGRRFKPNVKDKVIMVLVVYYRLYLTSQLYLGRFYV